MKKDKLYTADEIKKTYKQVHDLLVTKYIIKKYSTNHADIRKIAIAELDLSHVSRVIELGCGYGFFVEILKDRLPNDSIIYGIDLVENNKEAYIHTIESIGYKGEFIHSDVDIIKRMDNACVDMIIASYSLYFFPHIIQDVARVLKPHGIFIALTHSKYSLKEAIEFIPVCMKEIGLPIPEKIMLNKLFMAFSSEDGKNMLEPFFDVIEIVKYKNAMKFSFEHIDDCIYYIEKKRHLIYKEVLDSYPDRIIDIEVSLTQKIYEYAKKNKSIILTKDDAVFRCYK